MSVRHMVLNITVHLFTVDYMGNCNLMYINSSRVPVQFT